MVFSTDKILEDLRNVTDYATFHRIVSYVKDHFNDYSPHDYDIIQDNIEELEKKKFRPKACSQIKNIYYQTKEAYGSPEWTPLGINYSVGVCVDALELHIPLNEYLFDLFPDMATFRIEKTEPSEFEKSMLKSVFPSMEERRERKLAVQTEEMPETEIPVAINVAELLERQRSETEELVEAARSENKAEMERLRESINTLRQRLESSVVSPVQEREISRILDSSQYNYFQRNVINLDIPVRQKRIARGEYEVSVTVSSPEQEQKVLGFLADVEEHATVKVSRGRIRPPGFEEVLNLLCSKYEYQSGMACGLSRTGALSTLADRLIEYATNRGTEWDKTFDIYSLDLFAKKGSIYTREQADEAFNTAIRQIEGRAVMARTEGEFAEECNPENLLPYLLDYDAVGGIEVERYLPEMPERLVMLRDESVGALRKCDFYPNRLEELRSEADIIYGEMGTSYNDQLSALMDKYVRQYGEGE